MAGKFEFLEKFLFQYKFRLEQVKLNEIFDFNLSDIKKPEYLKLNNETCSLIELRENLFNYFRNLTPESDNFPYQKIQINGCRRSENNLPGYLKYCENCANMNQYSGNGYCTIIELFSRENKYLLIKYLPKNYGLKFRIQIIPVDFQVPDWYFELINANLMNFDLMQKLEKYKNIFNKTETNKYIEKSKYNEENKELALKIEELEIKLKNYSDLELKKIELMEIKKKLIKFYQKLKLEKLKLKKEKEELDQIREELSSVNLDELELI